MKILLIQQADSTMAWEAQYDAEGFLRAVETEKGCRAAPVSVKRGDASAYRVYTGTAPASVQTAELLFDLKEAPEQTPLLDDPPLSPFRDDGRVRPLRQWQRMGRLQWFFGSAQQAETRRDTLRRVGRFLDAIEAEERDCIVICRGVVMVLLKGLLRRRGYCLEGGELLPKALDRVRATRQSLHCGGCHHNCLLSAPKCQIGMNKAKGNL